MVIPFYIRNLLLLVGLGVDAVRLDGQDGKMTNKGRDFWVSSKHIFTYHKKDRAQTTPSRAKCCPFGLEPGRWGERQRPQEPQQRRRGQARRPAGTPRPTCRGGPCPHHTGPQPQWPGTEGAPPRPPCPPGTDGGFASRHAEKRSKNWRTHQL